MAIPLGPIARLCGTEGFGGRAVRGEVSIRADFGLVAYVWWGLVPLYFAALKADVPAWEILAHRIVWSSC